MRSAMAVILLSIDWELLGLWSNREWIIHCNFLDGQGRGGVRHDYNITGCRDVEMVKTRYDEIRQSLYA